MGLGHLSEDRRVDCSRRHAVDAHAGARKLLRERLGKGDHSGLARAVGACIGIAFLARDRCDVDDAAVVALAHAGCDQLRADEGAREVDPQHSLPVLERIIPGAGVRTGDAGIVHEDVDAGEFLLRGFERHLRGCRIGDIGGDPKGHAGQHRLHVIYPPVIQVPNGDFGP